MSPPEPLSQLESFALTIAGLIRDGERVAVGTNLPAVRAGALLAKLTHAPGATLFLGMAEVTELPPTLGDLGSLVADLPAQRHWRLEAFFAEAASIDLFVVGALQIDPFGNANLLGTSDIAGDPLVRYRQRRVIGPGAIGTTTMSTYAQRYVLFAPEHTPRVFVPTLDFRSSVGFGSGGDDHDRLGLPGAGPAGCLTPLGLFDFPPPEHRMRLIRPAPGATFAQIQAQTGFPLIRPRKVIVPAPPPADLVALLRTRVDPHGTLRQPA